MTPSNRDRVGYMLDLVRAGLRPFIEREFKRTYASRWHEVLLNATQEAHLPQSKDPFADVAFLLKLMFDQWNAVFRDVLGFAERSYVGELRNVRNRWAHQEAFSDDDADRALDTGQRLLEAVVAPEAAEIRRMKQDLRQGWNARTSEPPTTKEAGGAGDDFANQVAAAGPNMAEAIRLMDALGAELGLHITQSHAARKYRVGRDGAVAWIQPQQRMLFFDLRTLAKQHPEMDVAGLRVALARLSSHPSTSDMPPIPVKDVVENWPRLVNEVVKPFFRGTGAA